MFLYWPYYRIYWPNFSRFSLNNTYGRREGKCWRTGHDELSLWYSESWWRLMSQPNLILSRNYAAEFFVASASFGGGRLRKNEISPEHVQSHRKTCTDDHWTRTVAIIKRMYPSCRYMYVYLSFFLSLSVSVSFDALGEIVIAQLLHEPKIRGHVQCISHSRL